ncbi:MAG: death on curing protein [Parcubacteria group bacterium Gr01-1014_29]|nr:MAG: death on curing protein [Parcubacteria group bacterium Gr01-1014_29]
MKYLEAEDILVIHARIIDATGGSHGVRDINGVKSIAERPRMKFGGKDLYPTIFHKAAAYFESTAFFHLFIDGNKRTAITLAARFLYLNGYVLDVPNSAMEKFVLDAVVEKYELKKVADWFKKNSKKSKK